MHFIDTCVFDFDNTITGSDNNIGCSKNLHLWKVINGHYKLNVDMTGWDKESLDIMNGKYNVQNFKYATSLVTRFMGGINRLARIREFFKSVSKHKNIFISSNGDVQIIYYFLLNAGIIQYISGIHGRMFGDPKRHGCLLYLPNMVDYQINPFDNKYCMSMYDEKINFMNYLIHNGVCNKILFVDDNNEYINNKNIIVFSHKEFKYEGNGLTQNCCNNILNILNIK